MRYCAWDGSYFADSEFEFDKDRKLWMHRPEGEEPHRCDYQTPAGDGLPPLADMSADDTSAAEGVEGHGEQD